ncbi:MAG: carboxypeptidase-like regulatory domain-containing protein [Cyanobacteria bacterium P01_E01_bin.6]
MPRERNWKGWVGKQLMFPMLGLWAIAIPERAIAHGATIEYRSIPALEVQASYDTGEPLANAQVTVYSPENPADPWLTGTTDDQGRFIFTPDSAIAGNWDVQVRQAGHGDIVSIPLEGTASNQSTLVVAGSGSSQSTSLLQKAVMAGSVIWGLVGTALFFSARSKKHAHS